MASPSETRAELGCFIVRGKAWFDERGEMLIDEDGDIPPHIGWELIQHGDGLYEEKAIRRDATPRAGARPVYEMRWCPVPKTQKPKSKSSNR
jgi:hypothetical protein